MIKDEVEFFLNENIKNSANKSRDTLLIMFYLGLSGEVAPSLEDCAKKFSVGDQSNPNRKAERPRQIIDRKFYKKAMIADFPSLKKLDSFLSSVEFLSAQHYYDFCEKNNIADVTIHPFSLLRMLSEFEKSETYKLYSLEFEEISRAKAVIGDEFVIAKESKANNYRKALSDAKFLPGSIGIAKLELINEIIEKYEVDKEVIVKAMKSDKDSWFDVVEGEEYFLYENRDNMYINFLEKVASITAGDSVERMAYALSNASKSRTAKVGEYPPIQVVEKYLLSSKFTIVKGKYIQLNIEKKELNEIENIISSYMKKGEWYDPTEIRDFLKSTSKFQDVHINKSVYNSPLIYVDKSLGRKKFKCCLIGSEYIGGNKVFDRYEFYKQKLMLFSKSGTDVETDVLLRKEQRLLREWLFNNTSFSNCAICRRKFSNSALVAAHKKNRSNCSDNERTDPYIVMPLCVFGCDYLYEKKLIRIGNDGTINSNFEGIDLDMAEYDLLLKINGTILNERWFKGNVLYFTS